MLEEPEFLLPFEFMEVGNSFFLPTLRIPQSTYNVDTRAKIAGIKIKIYPAVHEGFVGIRIWRIA